MKTETVDRRPKRRRRLVPVLLAVVAMEGCSRGTPAPAPEAVRPTISEQVSGTRALLQAVSPVNDQVVWASGHRATWARTTDGGRTWQARSWTDADSVLEFRDVHAVSATTAYLLAAGPGSRSRIYKTTDGGTNWQLQFFNPDSAAFFDCFDFWDANHGIAVSDAVNGRMIVISTEDGAHWTDISASLPPALPGEGAFAASGTCLVARPGGHAWIGTGAETGARVYHTSNRGRSWTVVNTPVVSGQASGISSVSFRDEQHGLALGGRIADANDRSPNTARTSDGGRTWTQAGRTGLPGSVYGSAFVPGLGATIVAASPKGLEYSLDDGTTWNGLSGQAYWAVAFSSRNAGWAVGPGGRITRINFSGRPE